LLLLLSDSGGQTIITDCDTFTTLFDDANATTTNTPVATAANGLTVYVHLPSSTPILLL